MYAIEFVYRSIQANCIQKESMKSSSEQITHCQLFKMRQESTFDSFCLSDQCLKSHTAFFRFDGDCLHVIEGHEIRSIHPTTFVRMFKTDLASKQPLSFDFGSSFSTLVGFIEEAVLEVTECLRSQVFEPFVRSAQQLTRKGEMLNVRDFTKGMAEGDYSLLEVYREFDEKGEGDLPSKVRRQIEDSLSMLLGQIDRIKLTILNWATDYSSKINDSNKNEEPVKPSEGRPANRDKDRVEDNSLALNQQKQKVSLPTKATAPENQQQTSPLIINQRLQQLYRHQNIKLQQEPPSFEDNETNTIHEEFRRALIEGMAAIEQMNNSEEEQDEEKSHHSMPPKTKIIEKPEKQPRLLTKKKRRPDFENIYEVAPNQIAIKEIYTVNKAFKTITSKYPRVKALHIFDKAFFTKAVFREIVNKFPNIQSISINTSVDAKVLYQFPIFALRNLNRLCLQWDLQKFQRQFFIQKYFVRKDYQTLHQVKAFHAAEAILNNVPRNSHLWLFTGNHLDSQFIAGSVHINLTSCEIPTEFLTKAQITGLRYLKINGVFVFTGNHTAKSVDVAISSIVRRNKTLRSLFLDDINVLGLYTYFNSEGIPEKDILKLSFEQINLLPELRQFSFTNKEIATPTLIPAMCIKNLKKLQSLYLHHISFSTDTEEQLRSTADILQDFTNLKNLSLYKCRDITSRHLSKLRSSCRERMEFLNLGKTNIDQGCLSIIAQMKQLRYLNIEQSPISGQQFLGMVKNYEHKYGLKFPLVQLNIKTKIPFWKFLCLRNLPSFLRNRHSMLSVDYQADPYKNVLTQRELLSRQVCLVSMQNQRVVDQSVVRSLATNNTELTMEKLLLLIHRQVDPGLQTLEFKDRLQIFRYRNLWNPQDIVELAANLPKLEYLNVSYHYNLAGIDYSHFKSLRNLTKDKYFMSNNIKVHDNTKIYCEVNEDFAGMPLNKI